MDNKIFEKSNFLKSNRIFVASIKLKTKGEKAERKTVLKIEKWMYSKYHSFL